MCFAILLSPKVNKMNVFVPQFGEFIWFLRNNQIIVIDINKNFSDIKAQKSLI